MHIDELLRKMIEMGASDLHLKAGQPPLIRLHGKLTPMDYPSFTEESLSGMLMSIVPPRMVARLEDERELDFSYQLEGSSRFRVNYFYQKGHLGAVLRQIPSEIPTLDGLGFPEILKEFVRQEQGLILVTGPTGSGKSTTLAAMINEINENEPKHIITVEDPMEFVHRDKMSLINQREVGFDTMSFTEALRRALRQDPDIILVGEMRDAETINIATKAAETGHLVFSTLHTNDAKQSVDRIINSFPPEEHHQVRMKLGLVLKAIISQRLLPRKEGKGRVAVQEIMINTPTIRKLIETGQTGQIDKIIEDSSTFYKMQSMNQALIQKWRDDLITEEDAIAISNSPSDLKIKMHTEKFGTMQEGQVAAPTGWAKAPPPENISDRAGGQITQPGGVR